MNYQHFIITRFNIPFMADEHASFLFSETYLSRRYELFERYCFPSIQSQTCQQFTWLVFFDERTPQTFRQRNQQLHDDYPNFQPVYINMDIVQQLPLDPYYTRETICCHPDPAKTDIEQRYEDEIGHNRLPQIWDKIIRSHLSADQQIIVTTRIDNDDAFALDMVSRVQANVTPTNIGKVICFDHGMQLDASHDLLQTYFYNRNHFMTYIETTDHPLQTIFYWNHYYICDYKDVIHIDNHDPMWLEVVHGGNAANTVEFKHRNHLILSYDLGRFNLHQQISIGRTFRHLLKDPNTYIIPKIRFYLKKARQKILDYLRKK